jgi:hypothetical protein
MSGTTIHMGDATIGARSGKLQLNGTFITDSVLVPSPTIATGFTQVGSKLNTIDATNNGKPGIIAISSDSGQYVTYITSTSSTTGNIYVSNNYGVAFTIINSATNSYITGIGTVFLSMGYRPYAAVAMSSSGQYQIAVEGYMDQTKQSGIFVSSDYGVTWKDIWGYSYDTDLSNWVQQGAANKWTGVVISGDGSKVLISRLAPNTYYANTLNYSITFPTDQIYLNSYEISVGENLTTVIQKIYINTAGNRLIIYTTDTSYGYNLYFWYYGNNMWYQASHVPVITTGASPFNYADPPSFANVSVTMTSDGELVCVYGQDSSSVVYCTRLVWDTLGDGPSSTALDRNLVINPTYPQSGNLPVTATADGKIQIIGLLASSSSYLYISYNSGINWTPISGLSSQIPFVNISSDGSYTFAVDFSNHLLRAYTATPTATNIVNPFTSSDPTQWPTAYQPGGPATVQEALDLIARFMKQNFGDTGGPGSVPWNSLT